MNKDSEQHTTRLFDELEFMLKSMGLWKNTEIDSSKLFSRTTFCCDTLVFEQWLPFKIMLRPMTKLFFKYLLGKVEFLIINNIDPLLSQQEA